MPSFATEFPIQPTINKGQFVAQVVTWLKDMKNSQIVLRPCDIDTGLDIIFLSAPNGEELRLREFNDPSGSSALGFRHDISDSEGRLWRTEAVLRKGVPQYNNDVIRIRTECIALNHSATLETPRKPFLIKTLLIDGVGGNDGEFSVSDEPVWLKESTEHLELAHQLTVGTATRYLPVVYISATAESRWPYSDAAIKKLAFDLGGIAHVVVEPNRAFSFNLKDRTSAQNVYGGAVAISLPGRGIVRRFFSDPRFPKPDNNLGYVRSSAIMIRSQMPAEGWDWTELQEQALRQQRIRDRNRLSAEETEKIYKEEIANLQDSIRQLKAQQQNYPSPTNNSNQDAENVIAFLSDSVGAEIYDGEFLDRIRKSAQISLERSEQIGLDLRSVTILRAIAEKLPVSPALAELRDDLKRATREPSRAAAELISLLSRHGYHQKSDNKHIRLVANDENSGLAPITLSKTPSDIRSLTNHRKQIERAMGIARDM